MTHLYNDQLIHQEFVKLSPATAICQNRLACINSCKLKFQSETVSQNNPGLSNHSHVQWEIELSEGTSVVISVTRKLIAATLVNSTHINSIHCHSSIYTCTSGLKPVSLMKAYFPRCCSIHGHGSVPGLAVPQAESGDDERKR